MTSEADENPGREKKYPPGKHPNSLKNLQPPFSGPDDPRSANGGRANRGRRKIRAEKEPGFHLLRNLARLVAEEQALDEEGNPMELAGNPITQAERILRHWASHGSYDQQRTLLEIAYGKTPTTIDVEVKPNQPLLDALAARHDAGQPAALPWQVDAIDGESTRLDED